MEHLRSSSNSSYFFLYHNECTSRAALGMPVPAGILPFSPGRTTSWKVESGKTFLLFRNPRPGMHLPILTSSLGRRFPTSRVRASLPCAISQASSSSHLPTQAHPIRHRLVRCRLSTSPSHLSPSTSLASPLAHRSVEAPPPQSSHLHPPRCLSSFLLLSVCEFSPILLYHSLGFVLRVVM